MVFNCHLYAFRAPGPFGAVVNGFPATTQAAFDVAPIWLWIAPALLLPVRGDVELHVVGKRISRESSPGHFDGNDVFYH